METNVLDQCLAHGQSPVIVGGSVNSDRSVRWWLTHSPKVHGESVVMMVVVMVTMMKRKVMIVMMAMMLMMVMTMMKVMMRVMMEKTVMAIMMES